MMYLNIIAEGNSEEDFVNRILTPHLAHFNVFVSCQKVHTGGNKIHPIKGGLGKKPLYRPIRRALERWVDADRNRTDVYYSTMLDFYAFPQDADSPFTPNIRDISDKYRQIERLEEAIFKKHNIPNLIPYVQLHEFETLILADVEQLKVMYPCRTKEIDKLKASIENQSVELVNDGFTTAPSKRIINAIPEHEGQKSTVGPIVLEDIGIEKLKCCCPHFSDWVTKLESLDSNP